MPLVLPAKTRHPSTSLFKSQIREYAVIGQGRGRIRMFAAAGLRLRGKARKARRRLKRAAPWLVFVVLASGFVFYVMSRSG